MSENMKDCELCSGIIEFNGRPLLYLGCNLTPTEIDKLCKHYSSKRVSKPSEIKLENVTVDYILVKKEELSAFFDDDKKRYNLSMAVSEKSGHTDIIESNGAISIYWLMPELDFYIVKSKDTDKFEKESEILLCQYHMWKYLGDKHD